MAETREGKFTLDVRRWCEKAKGNADKVVRSTAMECLSRVVMKTPVGNPDLWKHPPPAGYVGGRARGNWLVSIGDASGQPIDLVDPSGSQTIAAGSGVLSEAIAGPPIYLMNHLPYAVPLEYGWSTQTPLGMVRTTVAEFRDIVSDVVKELP